MYTRRLSSMYRVIFQRQVLKSSARFNENQPQPSCVHRYHSMSQVKTSKENLLATSSLKNRIPFEPRFMASEGSSQGSSNWKIFGGAITISVVMSSLYAYWKFTKQQSLAEKFTRSQTLNDSSIKEYLLATPPPYFEPARKIRNSNNEIGLKITLFQYQTCPFCCKARAFLDYFGFNYDVVEVNSVMRTQVKWSKYKKVPIVVVELKDGTVVQLNDSSIIVSVLRSFLQDKKASLESVLACYPHITSIETDGKEVTEVMNKYFLMYQEEDLEPAGKKQISNERKWRIWVDKVLVHTLSPNVYRTPTEALQAFRWFDQAGNWENHFSSWERTLVIYMGAFMMWLIGKKLKKRHNLKPDVRQSLYDEINVWLKAIKTNRTPFMGGQSPDCSDLAVFGVLSAIEGCEAFDDLTKNTKISKWFDLMKEECKNHGGQGMIQDKTISLH